MGANFLSIQVPDSTTAEVKAALLTHLETAKERIGAFVGPPLGRWTAVYPMFSPEIDSFAKQLSGKLDRTILTLLSVDDSNFICNVCSKGKDYRSFTINAVDVRSGKKRDAVTTKLDHLAPYVESGPLNDLCNRLCDTRHVTFGSDILKDFCSVLQIANARCSYANIEAGDFKVDLDVRVELEEIPFRR